MSLTTLPPRHGSLPAELTTFVGRRREIAEVKRLLSVSRLVTLTGVGGTGKTRLALRAAADMRRDFPGGVWFVDLAPLADPGLVGHTVSSTLGLHDQGLDLPIGGLVEYLEDKRLLLILDNCDHLRDACAALADALLRHAPGLRVLTTSRQTLGITGEQVYPVPPLSLPERAVDLPVDAVDAYEAMTLFVARAQAVRPSFNLSDETIGAAVAVCRRLDGIPLAIELAAARLSALSLHDLLERLEDRYQVLVGGSTTALPRHRTLRELVGWSWDLCTEHERRVWSSASVFRSGFDLPAAEAVCADDEVDRGAILDVLTGLVEKSILTAADTGGHVRYRMLETLQQFGHAELASTGREGAVLARHRAYYTGLASQGYGGQFSEHQTAWLDRLLLELGNLRVALDTSLGTSGLVDSGLELAADLWFVWVASGRTNEGLQWLDRGLQLAPAPTRIRTRALEMCAYLSLMKDDLERARPMIAEAASAAAIEADPCNLAWATQLQAMTALTEGDLTAAQPLFEDALARHRANQDLVGVADTSAMLALADALIGRLRESEAVSRDAIATCESHGERWLKSYLVWDLGLVAWRRGNTNEAIASTREALRLARDLGDPIAITLCLELLAWSAEDQGDAVAAVRLLGGARGVLQRIGWQRTGVPIFGLAGLTSYHDECVARLVDRMGSTNLESVLQEGSAMRRDQVIAAALGELALTTTGEPRRARTDDGGLTKRESEVADLVARGMSNKEIAAKLVISQRTAETHVDHILNKLGFTSRAQIAAWVVEHRADSRPTHGPANR